MEKLPCVYIITNKKHETLYIGVSSQLQKRIWLHKQKQCDGFAKKYNLTRLVYYECHGSMMSAITREKQIKKWNRAWKIELIDAFNSSWKDLYFDLV